MDFELARFNMIEQQIRPWDVLDQEVLDLLGAMRREAFVPAEYRNLAFSDLEIPLVPGGTQDGRCMLSPKLEARLLQEVAPRRHESVLEIGAGSGYMAALLAHRAQSVVTVDIDPTLADLARANLAAAGLNTVQVETGCGLARAQAGRFDVIVASGSMEVVPEALRQALNVGGRLICVVGRAPVMRAEIHLRAADDAWTVQPLFETVTAPLRNFPLRERFRF